MAQIKAHEARARRTMWAGLAFSMAAAVFYLLAGLGLASLGGLSAEEAPMATPYIAAACYTVGGFLIMAERRRLYADRPSVILSLAGIGTRCRRSRSRPAWHT